MIQLNGSLDEAMVEVHPQPQDDGTTDSTVEFHITPGGEIESFDIAGYTLALNDAVGLMYAMNLNVSDYTEEEYPAVVVEVWEFGLNPDEFDEDGLAEYLKDLTNAVNGVSVEDFIIRA